MQGPSSLKIKAEIEDFSEHEAPTKVYAPPYELLQESLVHFRLERTREASNPCIEPQELEASPAKEATSIVEIRQSMTRELGVLPEPTVPPLAVPRRLRVGRFLALVLFAALFSSVLVILALEASVTYGFPAPNETLLDMTKKLLAR